MIKRKKITVGMKMKNEEEGGGRDEYYNKSGLPVGCVLEVCNLDGYLCKLPAKLISYSTATTIPPPSSSPRRGERVLSRRRANEFQLPFSLRRGHGTCVPLFKLGIPATTLFPIDAAIITSGSVGVLDLGTQPLVLCNRVITRLQWLFVFPFFRLLCHGTTENV